MAFILDDRVRETSTAPGTGSFTMNGAVQAAQSFASALTANGDTTWYAATNGIAWETGLLTRTSATVYARTIIYASSNADAVVNFSTGTVDVFIDLPALRLVSYANGTDAALTLTAANLPVTRVGALTAPRVYTLPLANSVPAGMTLTIVDALFITPTNTLTIQRQGSDSLYGFGTTAGTSLVLNIAGAGATFVSDGVATWFRVGHDFRNLVVSIKKQLFTATGTYTPSTGMLYCLIELVGGGAGGGSSAGSLGQIHSGGGGGAGGLSRLLATAATIGASQAVTIGAAGAGGASGSNNGANGGDTSVGSLCIGKGGSGGKFGSVAQVPTGGAGGVAGTGDLTPTGAPGLPGFYNSLNLSIAFPSGGGGSSVFGGGGIGVNANTSAVAGVNAGNYGSGGSGAATNNVASNAAGGNGSAGVVWITEYCSQ